MAFAAPDRRRRLLLVAGASLVSLTALVLWDVQRQSALLAQRVGQQHRLLALALAGDSSRALARIRADARRLEQAAAVVVLFRLPEDNGYRSTDDRTLGVPAFDEALARGEPYVRLLRDEAARIGLPRRQAIAGLVRIDEGPAAGLRLAVVSSFARERDYVLHERWRAFISLTIAIALVTGFAVVLLREMAKEQGLTASLARADVERQRDEQLARADRMGSLAALSLGVAHELATPLGVIAARVEQLTAQPDPDERRARPLRAVADQVERMRAIIQGFLALARGDAPARAAVDAAGLASDAVELVRHRFAKAGVALVATTEASAEVRCDAALSAQALTTLLVNACQASPPGAQVALCTRVEDARVCFEISDEGPGMSDEAIAKATAPFFTTRAAEGGTGLGLAIASEIAQHHGGALEIARRGDRPGLRVILSLPRAEALT